MEQKCPKLRCCSEYRRLCQPMSEQEYAALEQETAARKDTVIIRTWSNIVLYDYEKYELCRKYCIPYKISRIYAHNSEEALVWLCKNQLKRMDLTSEMRRYLIGKRYLYEKILGAHDAAVFRASSSVRGQLKKNGARYDDCAVKTMERLAKEYDLVPLTIRKYSLFSEAMDIIYEISEELALEIFKGNIKISQEDVSAISKMQERKIRNMAARLLYEKKDFAAIAGSQKIITKAKEIPSKKMPSIKDMPEYDPDAEVSSLTLTIPSWISSIKRVCNSADMNKVSTYAKSKLHNELENLGNSIFEMFDIL